MNQGKKPILVLIALSLLFMPGVLTARSPVPVLTITPEGLGGYTVGRPKAKIAERLGKGNPNYDEPYQCDIHPIKSMDGVSVVIERGIVTSTKIESKAYATESGARVGMTDAQIKKIYGSRLKKTEHTYDDAPAAYYTLRSTNGNKIVFDVGSNRRVNEIRTGRSASYVEGCL